MSDASDDDRAFYDLADRFVELANEQSRSDEPPRISAAFLFAASRYNAFLAREIARAGRSREELLEYFVDQYRRVLEQNMRDLAVGEDRAVRED